MKIHEIFIIKFAKFVFVCLQCLKREHVHNTYYISKIDNFLLLLFTYLTYYTIEIEDGHEAH